jgi:prepilin-type N-terminal cleavage/methylation domain-containing protein
MKRIQPFTLIELLVVVAILAVLISLFAPSMKWMMYRSSNLVCVMNFKTLQKGFLMYSDDNEDLWPDRADGKYRDRINKLQEYKWNGTSKKHVGYSILNTLRPYFGRIGKNFVCPLYGIAGGHNIDSYGNSKTGLEKTILTDSDLPGNGFYVFDERNGKVNKGKSKGTTTTFSYMNNLRQSSGSVHKYYSQTISRLGDKTIFKKPTVTNVQGYGKVDQDEVTTELLMSDYVTKNLSVISDRYAPDIKPILETSYFVITTHKPPPGEEYKLLSDGRYLIKPNSLFYTNWAYQDGRVNTIESNTISISSEYSMVAWEGKDGGISTGWKYGLHPREE